MGVKRVDTAAECKEAIQPPMMVMVVVMVTMVMIPMMVMVVIHDDADANGADEQQMAVL